MRERSSFRTCIHYRRSPATIEPAIEPAISSPIEPAIPETAISTSIEPAIPASIESTVRHMAQGIVRIDLTLAGLDFLVLAALVQLCLFSLLQYAVEGRIGRLYAYSIGRVAGVSIVCAQNKRGSEADTYTLQAVKKVAARQSCFFQFFLYFFSALLVSCPDHRSCLPLADFHSCSDKTWNKGQALKNMPQTP
jgi:hypothetical protein